MKTETLKKASKQYCKDNFGLGFFPAIEIAFEQGAKWQEQRMYSEEEVLELLYKNTEDRLKGLGLPLEEWFNQNKKK